jgi:hypothetical protein
MPDRVSSTQIGTFFARVTRAGEASRRAYEGKRERDKKLQISDLKFQMEETATANVSGGLAGAVVGAT